MPRRTRHPRLAAAACRIYGLAIFLYPGDFRRAFGDELMLTFRNQVEDALDGGVLDCLAFAVLIAFDWLRTFSTLVTQPRSEESIALLGLREGDVALGGIDRTLDASLVFAVAGFLFTAFGLYFHIVTLPSYIS